MTYASGIPTRSARSDLTSPQTQPTPELLSTLGLYSPDTEEPLDVRIDHIRESMLSAYPPVPNLSAPRLDVTGPVPFTSANSHPGSSRIPRAKLESTKASSSSNEFAIPVPQTPKSSPRQLITSTPPPTVKPRSAKICKHGVGQTVEKHNLRRGSKLPRKSIRFSLATDRRPSLFAIDDDSDEEDEVHRVSELP